MNVAEEKKKKRDLNMERKNERRNEKLGITNQKKEEFHQGMEEVFLKCISDLNYFLWKQSTIVSKNSFKLSNYCITTIFRSWLKCYGGGKG